MAKEFRERREGEKVADYRDAKQRWKIRQESKAREEAKAQESNKQNNSNKNNSNSNNSNKNNSNRNNSSRNNSSRNNSNRNNNQSSSTKPKNQPAAPVAKPEREKGQDKQEYRNEVKDWRKEKRMAGDRLKNEVKSGNNNPLNPVNTSKGPTGPVAPGKPQSGTGFVKPENVPGVPQGNKPTGPVPQMSQPRTSFVKPENVPGVPQGGGPTGPVAPGKPKPGTGIVQPEKVPGVPQDLGPNGPHMQVDSRPGLGGPAGPTQNNLTKEEITQYSSYLNQNKDVSDWYNDAKGEGMAGGQGGYHAAHGSRHYWLGKRLVERNE